MHESRAKKIRHAVVDLIGCDENDISFRAAGGGCINSAALVEAKNETFFAKWNDRPLPHQFEAEGLGLEAMYDASTSLTIPRPLQHDDSGPNSAFLLIEYLPSGSRIADFEVVLGQGLAQLHRTTSAKGFGFDIDGYCGATPQPNGWASSWLTFYRDKRLGHQVQLAKKRGLSSRELKTYDQLLNKLDVLLEFDEPPALIHGDLWSGNLHVGPEGEPSLIDPAAYYGHREAELGMMVLFGGFSKRVFDAYDEAYPLTDGWRERLDLYTLYHVLNHYNLFGGGYGSQALRIAQQYI